MANFAVLTKNIAEEALFPFLAKKGAENQNPNNSTAFPGHIFILMSLDLKRSEEKIKIDFKENSVLIRNEKVSFDELKKMKEETIYAVIEGKLLAVELFGTDTNLYYKLKPTFDWPTITLSSVPMHRFKTVSPKTSAELMVKEISPVRGVILDCCCGLGYTSIIEASKSECEKVIVFEKDENVLTVARYNPYSDELFSNKKIELIHESVLEGIKKIKNNSVDRILHDPPTTSFGKDLFSAEFYVELYRVLKPNGILYHYCPNPGKTKGKEFWPTIEKMLKKSGFVDIKYHKESSGLRAVKK